MAHFEFKSSNLRGMPIAGLIQRLLCMIAWGVCINTSWCSVTDVVSVNLNPSSSTVINRRALGVNIIPWSIFTNSSERALAVQLFDDFSRDSVLRYGGGGGLLADTYFWETNVGYDRQPQDFFAIGTQSNIDTIIGSPCAPAKVAYLANGTDEILQFTEAVGAKGLLTLNAGATRTNGGLWSPRDAAPFNFSNTWSREGRAIAWVDYVNSPTTSTGMGYIRNTFGRESPYGVEVLEIGNEHYIPNTFNGSTVYWNHTLDGTSYGQRALSIADAVMAAGSYTSAVRFAYSTFEWDHYYPHHTNPVNPAWPSNQKYWNANLSAVLATAGSKYRPGTDLLVAHQYSGTPFTDFGNPIWYRDMISTSLEDNAHIEDLKSI